MRADFPVVVTGSCRRCAAAVHASANHVPVYRCIAECSRCHYRTVLRDDPIDLPFAKALKPLFSAEEIDSVLRQAEDPGSACVALIERSYDKVSALVQEHREVAIAGCWT